MKIELLPPSQGDLLAPAELAVVMANELVIDSQEMADAAADELRAIARRKDALDKQRKELTSPLDEFKKKVMDLFRPAIDRLGEAEGILKRSLLAWNNEQTRLRQLEDLRRREAAELERKRLEEEAEAARKLAEVAVATGDAAAADVALQFAERAEMMTEMVIAPPPSVPVAKVAGTSVRETPDPEVFNKLELLKYAAAHPELAGLFDVNMTALRGLAKVCGIGSSALPGVRIVAKQTLATSRR